MKEVVLTESYVEQYAREHHLGKYAEPQKEDLGIPSESEMGISSDEKKGIPSDKAKSKEVKKNVKNTGSKG